MRLFLSSQNFGNHESVLAKIAGENKKVVYIGNAKDDWSKEEKDAKEVEHKKEFEALGFEFENIDLREYFGGGATLEEKLKAVGLIWLSGGNTFLLRRALYDSKLDKLLIEGLKNDKFIFGGSSAGSIMATPSLHGTEWGDDPSQVEKIYKKEILWDGLNLVSFYFVPHYKSDWFGKEADLMIDHLRSKNLKYYAVQDGQVILVNGGKIELLK